MRRLLENLLRNADEHCESPVTVTVGRTADGFYLADNGPGLDEMDREQVFEPGYTTAVDGTGFGLTIVKRIADAHGWEVSISDSASGGVRFDFIVNPEAATRRDTPLSS